MISYDKNKSNSEYHDRLLNLINSDESTLSLGDHLCGFDQELNNLYLDTLVKKQSNQQINVEYFIDDRILKKYPTLNLKFSLDLFIKGNYFNDFKSISPIQVTKVRGTTNEIENFLCSFNGSPHPGRILLVSALSKFGFLNEGYCSKNFTFDPSELANFLNDRRVESLFFDYTISNKIMSFQYERFNHNINYYALTPKILNSFLHIVSETAATSYYPFVTEKFLYSIVNKGLFLAYAQPGWHDYLEKYLGFKKYNKIFDYSFDSIQDPIERLIALLTMISKFSKLNKEEWNLLYFLERETIKYNYNHYINGKYIRTLQESGQI